MIILPSWSYYEVEHFSGWQRWDKMMITRGRESWRPRHSNWIFWSPLLTFNIRKWKEKTLKRAENCLALLTDHSSRRNFIKYLCHWYVISFFHHPSVTSGWSILQSIPLKSVGYRRWESWHSNWLEGASAMIFEIHKVARTTPKLLTL